VLPLPLLHTLTDEGGERRFGDETATTVTSGITLEQYFSAEGESR